MGAGFSDLAERVLKKHWSGVLPVDPRKLAEAMGVRVIEDACLGVSGMFSKDNGVPTIWYDSNEPTVRQRFTIAHELGHFCLGHDGVFRDPTKNFSSHNYDRKEASANNFAASLLMPGFAVSKHVGSGTRDVSRLADIFKVSPVAMKYRLKNLGMVG